MRRKLQISILLGVFAFSEPAQIREDFLTADALHMAHAFAHIF